MRCSSVIINHEKRIATLFFGGQSLKRVKSLTTLPILLGFIGRWSGYFLFPKYIATAIATISVIHLNSWKKSEIFIVITSFCKEVTDHRKRSGNPYRHYSIFLCFQLSGYVNYSSSIFYSHPFFTITLSPSHPTSLPMAFS